MKKMTLFLMVLLSIACISQAQETNEKIRLKLQFDSEMIASTSLEATSRSQISMLFFPEVEMYLGMEVNGTFKAGAASDGMVLFESTTDSVKMEYYTAGQPNQSLDEKLIDHILWTSGIMSEGTTGRQYRTSSGNIVRTENIPERYEAYFKNDLLYYPNKDLAIGDRWSNKFIQPVSPDPNQPDFEVEISVDYRLENFVKEQDLAEISFKMGFKRLEEESGGGEFSLSREGTLWVNLSTGLPMTSKSVAKYSMIYSEHNFVKSEDHMEAIISRVKTDADNQD